MKIKRKNLNSLTNSLAYHIQDILDDLASGGRFSLKQAEKEIKKTILAFTKKGEPLVKQSAE